MLVNNGKVILDSSIYPETSQHIISKVGTMGHSFGPVILDS